MILSIEEIREKLRDRNLSEVARNLSISRQSLYNYVNGKHNPTYKVHVEISNYLNKGEN